MTEQRLPAGSRSDRAVAEDLLREFLRCSRTHQDWMECSTGVPAAELRLLRQLASGAPRQARTLASAMYLHPSTISNVLRRLRARGWLTETISPDDRRAKQISLSAQGVEAARRLAPYSRGFAFEVVRSADAAQVASLTTGLATLVACIPRRWRRPPPAAVISAAALP